MLSAKFEHYGKTKEGKTIKIVSTREYAENLKKFGLDDEEIFRRVTKFEMQSEYLTTLREALTESEDYAPPATEKPNDLNFYEDCKFELFNEV